MCQECWDFNGTKKKKKKAKKVVRDRCREVRKVPFFCPPRHCDNCSHSSKHVGGSLAGVARAAMVGGRSGERRGEEEQMAQNSQGLFQESSAFTAHILT